MGPTEPQTVGETHREAGRGQRYSQGHKELQDGKDSGEEERGPGPRQSETCSDTDNGGREGKGKTPRQRVKDRKRQGWGSQRQRNRLKEKRGEKRKRTPKWKQRAWWRRD